MKINFIIAFIVLITFFSLGQEVQFGTNNYVEYQIGTLPIVISVPHGGALEPSSVPDRTCNDPVYATDSYTIQTALEIKSALFALTGCYPHIIISHLKRKKLDPNRNIADGACGNPDAELAWTEFQNFITVARDSANSQYDNNTFFVDLHGHGNSIQRIELGYLLFDDELELSDETLNSSQYIGYSSIQNLALNNATNLTHAQLLKGEKSFGSLLADQSYPAVPSEDIPFPGTSSNYYSGGYITANHTCYNPDASINGVQMELNYDGVRDNSSNRTAFGIGFSRALIEFLNTHFDMDWNSCAPSLTSKELSLENEIRMYPNPILSGERILFDFLETSTYNFDLFNSIGQQVLKGELSVSQNEIETNQLNAGIYFVHLSEATSGTKAIFKLVVD